MKYEIKLKFPNEIVWDYHKKCNNTYLKKYGDKIVYIFSYLQGMTNNFGQTCFTLGDLINKSGMKIKTGRNNSTNQFKYILKQLQHDEIIQANIDFDNIKLNTFITCEFHMPFAKDEDTNFFCIPIENHQKIMDCNNKKINRLTLLNVYYYINARLRRRKTNVENNACDNDFAETFYDKYKKICTDLGVSEQTWNTYIKELRNLDLVFFGNIGRIKKKGKKGFEKANNVYCLSQIELDKALVQSKEYYMGVNYSNDNIKLKVIDIQNVRKIKINTNKNQSTIDKGYTKALQQSNDINLEKKEIFANNAKSEITQLPSDRINKPLFTDEELDELFA